MLIFITYQPLPLYLKKKCAFYPYSYLTVPHTSPSILKPGCCCCFFNLEPGLLLSHTTLAGVPHYAVFCGKQAVPKGRRFGPFKGKVVNPSEMKTFDDNGYMWEVRASRIFFFVFVLFSIFFYFQFALFTLYVLPLYYFMCIIRSVAASILPNVK